MNPSGHVESSKNKTVESTICSLFVFNVAEMSVSPLILSELQSVPKNQGAEVHMKIHKLK